jgi:Big-like domain-containing protein
MRNGIIVLLFAAVSFSACGDGGDDELIGPPTPAAVASVAVTPTELNLTTGDTVSLAVTVRDATGRVLVGRTITFASSDLAVASVDSQGLVTAVAGGLATLTATSEGVDGVAAATILDPVFEPAAAVELVGDNRYSTVSIPAGVTVTLTGDAQIIATDAVDIAGSITGDCTAFSLSGLSVTVTGSVDNRCSTNPLDAPDLTVAATSGDLIFTGATFQSSGEMVFTNDAALAALSDSEFLAQGSTLSSASGRALLASRCEFVGVTMGSETNLGPTATGTSTVGGNGGKGSSIRFTCSGDMVGQNSTLNGSSGGDGENRGAAPESRGGNGGDGGDVVLRATGEIRLSESGVIEKVEIWSGVGGNGGQSEVSGEGDGSSATATGGDGGSPGRVKILAKGAVVVVGRGLAVVIREGGNGGKALATGREGAPGGMNGGDATAVGGDGGGVPEDAITIVGSSVTGVTDDMMSGVGVSGGRGGDSFANAGLGSAGDASHPAGGKGGDLSAQGGNGGDGLAVYNGVKLGPGGAAGGATFTFGWGGRGMDGCLEDPKVVGGWGGDGGNASGGDGRPGSGKVMGAFNILTIFTGVGSGGPAGDGTSGGIGGAQGVDNTTTVGEKKTFPPIFLPGDDGNPCAAESEISIDVSALPSEFTHVVGTTPCPTVIGTFVIRNNSATLDMSWTSTTAAPLGMRIGEGTASTTQTGTVPAGGSTTVTVIFDCSQTTSFDGSVNISVTNANGNQQVTHAIAGTVG